MLKGRRTQVAVQPQSMVMLLPVKQAALSEQR
jgi:hypothetical protein